jgi:5'-deoxynucleotidase YfbR-like HD superfamily hydrolase
MFFKKRKEMKAAEKAAQEATIVANMQEHMMRSQGVDDPVERLMMLDDLQKDILQQRENIAAGNWQEDLASMIPAVGVGGTTITAAYIIVTTFAFPPAAMILAVIPGSIGAIYAGEKCRTYFAKNQAEKIKGFLQRLDEVQAAVDVQKRATIDAHIVDIARSEKVDMLLERIPSLKDDFSKAFREERKEVVPSEPKQPNEKRKSFDL